MGEWGCGSLASTVELIVSELKDQSPDAVDISDLNAAKEVGSQAEAERRIIELERKRLRTEDEPDPAISAPLTD